MRSQSQHQFSMVPSVNLERSTFDRSFIHKTTINEGYLYPLFIDEALPGDTFKITPTIFARLLTPLKYPMLDNMYIDIHWFAVPRRILWDNWTKMLGEQTNPGDSLNLSVNRLEPITGAITTTESAMSLTLWDYMGIPVTSGTMGTPTVQINALFPRAYYKIWNRWFRDENLQSSLIEDTGDGPDITSYVLQQRGKRKDYFTSAHPWPQKFGGASIGLAGTAAVIGNGTALGLQGSSGDEFALELTNVTTGLDYIAASHGIGGSTGSTGDIGGRNDLTINRLLGLDTTAARSGMVADLTTATAITINSLRQAMQLQRLMERDARGGTRYAEILMAHFKVKDPLFSVLQWPEFLGSQSQRMNVSTVPQTSQTTTGAGGSPQANLAAFSTGAMSGNAIVHSFTEHSIIMGLVSIRADMTYQQGINRMFMRRSRYDHYWPVLAHIGEQSILNYEIYFQGTAADQDVFGYQERHGEYRYKPGIISGLLRSAIATPLDSWHLAQTFAALPILGDTFIKETPPIARIVAVPSTSHFLVDAYFQNIATRPMPTYAIPGMMDHF